jgi:hypothetical protein
MKESNALESALQAGVHGLRAFESALAVSQWDLTDLRVRQEADSQVAPPS